MYELTSCQHLIGEDYIFHRAPINQWTAGRMQLIPDRQNVIYKHKKTALRRSFFNSLFY